MEKSNSNKHFLIIKNEQTERIIDLESATYSIGRAVDNPIVLNSPKISRYHATLLRITAPRNDGYQFRIIDGDLNHHRSRNGIKVNGRACFSYDLQHDDVITFAENITATYQTVNVSPPVEVEISESFFPLDDDVDATAALDDSSFNSVNSTKHTVGIHPQQREKSIQQSLERLASFPELFSDPIVELDFRGNITYLNPAALKLFPALKQDKSNHPLIKGILDLVKVIEKKSFVREVKINNRIFEQSIHLIASSRLIRCYISDITKRKRAEILLKKAHRELEQRVEERTSELVHNNEILKLEIAEREQKEQEIILLQTIIQAITQASSFNDAIAITLRKVCQTVDWSFGEAWIPNPGQQILQLSPAYYSNSAKLEYFREASQKLTYPIDVGPPGRVWLTKKSEWIEDISTQTKDLSPRYKIARSIGLRTSLAVPMIANQEVIAILVFHNFTVHTQNQQMLELVESVAAQLALIIERKKVEDALQSSMATNKAILNAIPDLILRVDRQGIFVNYKAAKYNNFLSFNDELIGKHVSEIFNQEISLSIMNCINQAFKTGEVQIMECQITDDNHKIHSYELRIAVSEIDEVMAIVRDITERKQAEEDICQTLEQQQKLNELKSRFVTMTSHEFRTPLASILSSSELLEHYSHKWSEEKKLSHLYRIQNSVKHMTELLNDVLLLGKADAGKLELKPHKIDLVQYCHQLIEEFELTVPTHQIIFQVPEFLETNNVGNQSTTGYVDEKVLKHIIYNLLSNAVKYSPDSDRVYFELSCQPQQVTFKVQDFGIGIPQEAQQQLFESFHRADNVGSIPGTGLGLPIVKRSVDLHGGEILVDSTINQGTIFTITIPYLTAKQNLK